MDDQLVEYRKCLVDAEREMQAEYDRTVLALSGGALGVSFAFLKDFVGAENVTHLWALGWAWGLWGTSSTVVLGSFFTSHMALRSAIVKFDAAKGDYSKLKNLGGGADALTKWLNFGGLIFFLAGVIMMAVFVIANLKLQKKSVSETPVPPPAQVVPIQTPAASNPQPQAQPISK